MEKETKNFIFAVITVLITLGGLAFILHTLPEKEPVLPDSFIEQIKEQISKLDLRTFAADIGRAQEEAKSAANNRREYEESKAKWIEENPPVDEFFDEKRIGDVEYVVQYLRKYGISGHCAFVHHGGVICAEFGGKISFPLKPKFKYIEA